MTFEITPEGVDPLLFAVTPEASSGPPAEPENTADFAVDPVATALPDGTPEPLFIQWQLRGADLGAADVQIVNFVYPLIATRGVGEHANVITVRKAPPPPDIFTYFTSILYPFIFEDAMSIGLPVPNRGYVMEETVDPLSIDLPELLSGTLVASIAFLTYDGRGFPDPMSIALPELLASTLVVTISYLTYDPSAFPDPMSIPHPELRTSTLVVTIAYVDYLNAITYPDPMSIALPTLQSGTLV